MKIFLQLTIVFLGCFFRLQLFWGEEWIFYARYTDSYYFDRENINNPDENSHDIVGVWQKIVYADTSISRISDHLGEQYSDLAESVSLVEMNCLSAEAQIKAITYYDSKGGIIHTSHKTKDDWKEVIPFFPLHKLYKAVCPPEAR